MPPHVHKLEKHTPHYILGAKPKDHEYLYQGVDEAVEAGHGNELHLSDPDKADVHHCFRSLNDVARNKCSEESLRINFLEYWQSDDAGNVQRRFAWVRDINLTQENVYNLMRAGRARWRMENETFHTLKNQGYHLGHTYGLGKKDLSALFVHLMVLAFLIDQVQQMCCPLFQAAPAKSLGNKYLWEDIRKYCQWNPQAEVEIQWE